MSCEFRDRLRERIITKPGAYQLDQVRAQLEQLATGIISGSSQLTKSVPREADGYELRGKVDQSNPRWQGQQLRFGSSFILQAKFLMFWIDLVELQLEGTFSLKHTDDVVETLDASLDLRFDARDQVIHSLKGKIPPVEGQPKPADTCRALQGLMTSELTKFLRTVRDQTRTSLQAFRR